MAKRTWIGTLPSGVSAVQQVSTAVVTAYDAATTYSIIVTGEDGLSTTISVTGDTDVNGTATALRAAWNASTHALARVITASGTGANVVLTADTAGIPFFVATSESGGTGTIGDFTLTTANVGSNDYGCALNWYEGAVPVADDDVTIQGSANITYSLNQSAVELDDFIVVNYTGQIGFPYAPLQIDAGNGDVQEFSGSGVVYIDFGGAAVSPIIRRTATVAPGLSGLYLKGSALATVQVLGGNVRLVSGSTATTVYVAEGAVCVVESGVTLTTLQSGGTTTLSSAATTLRVFAGTTTTQGSGAITTVDVDGGTAHLNSTGTIGTLNADGGLADMTRCLLARTVTDRAIRGGELRYDPAIVTMTNATSASGPISVRRAA